jgi:hypothetical protein
MSKWKVLKHDCLGTRGGGGAKACDPPCSYPWEVDGPDGEISDVFVTWPEALEWARKKVGQHD